jgi:hypothetical protein
MLILDRDEPESEVLTDEVLEQLEETRMKLEAEGHLVL